MHTNDRDKTVYCTHCRFTNVCVCGLNVSRESKYAASTVGSQTCAFVVENVSREFKHAANTVGLQTCVFVVERCEQKVRGSAEEEHHLYPLHILPVKMDWLLC
jgi:hypothetical protein